MLTSIRQSLKTASEKFVGDPQPVYYTIYYTNFEKVMQTYEDLCNFLHFKNDEATRYEDV